MNIRTIRLAIAFILLLLMAACVTAPEPLPTPTAPAATATSVPTATLAPTIEPSPTLTPEPTVPPVTGTNWLRPADGMLMMNVPAGEFKMGSNDRPDQKPIHTVYLDEYWVDQTEVTNSMYARCVAAGVCKPPIRSGSILQDRYYGDPQYDNHPVVYVSQSNAATYCAWTGSRLPSEAEWEKAARGTDGRKYPWGNTLPTCKIVAFLGCVNDAVAVGSYPAGASPYGALDMSGNVWEFVSDWYGEAYYSQSPASNPTGPTSGDGGYVVLRGGASLTSEEYLRTYYRLDDGPDNMYPHFGFRCVRSLP